MNNLEVYLNSLNEGDNITITADFLNVLKEANEIIKIVKEFLDCSYKTVPVIDGYILLDDDDFLG